LKWAMKYTEGKMIMFFIMMTLVGCTDTSGPSEPKSDHRYRCNSKSAGSTPSCWNNKDWEEFCKRVECKQTN
jgi:hypothetical protein